MRSTSYKEGAERTVFKVTVVSCANDMEELRSTVEMIPRNIPEIRHMILANNDGDSDADDYE